MQLTLAVAQSKRADVNPALSWLLKFSHQLKRQENEKYQG